jgi:hypothetical protein
MAAKSTKWVLAGFTLLLGMTLLLPITTRASPGDTLYVQNKGVNVLETPSTDAPVVMQIGQGRKLKEFSRQGEWVKVIIYGEIGKDGWVKSSDVGPQNPAAESSQAPVSEPEKAEVATGKTEPSAAPTGGPPFILVVGARGSIPDRFQASCRVLTATGKDVRRKMSGLSPKAYSFAARAVDCGVRKSSKIGRLNVHLERGGRLIASHSTTRSFGHVLVRSSGPWGRARGVRCNPTRTSCIE